MTPTATFTESAGGYSAVVHVQLYGPCPAVRLEREHALAKHRAAQLGYVRPAPRQERPIRTREERSFDARMGMDI